MKKLPIILYSILLAIMLGLLGYEVFYLHNSDSGFYLKAGLALIAILAAMIRSATGSRRRVSNKKAVYSKAYAPFIGSAFSREPKLEKRFYNAVDLYNRNKPAAAVTQLEKLRTHCSHSDDYYALTVFTALCYDDMRLYAEAAALYEKAVQMRPNSTLVSNMGLCFDRMGDSAAAMDAYQQAVQLDDKNFTAYNNMAQLCIRTGDFVSGLECAQTAVSLNGKMPQALNALTICHYMLGHQAEYEQSFRQAVSCGSDAKALKAYLKSMDPTL